jgi:hypothetical protein
VSSRSSSVLELRKMKTFGFPPRERQLEAMNFCVREPRVTSLSAPWSVAALDVNSGIGPRRSVRWRRRRGNPHHPELRSKILKLKCCNLSEGKKVIASHRFAKWPRSSRVFPLRLVFQLRQGLLDPHGTIVLFWLAEDECPSPPQVHISPHPTVKLTSFGDSLYLDSIRFPDEVGFK